MARILLIDDDAGLREVLAFALEDFGHEVAAHPDGEGGLSALGTFRPDVVITDLKMPGIDGVEVVRRVREADPSVPVIVLTAFGSVADAVEVMKLGAYDYVAKPYNREELKLTIDQAIERRRLLAENRTLRDRLRESTRTTGLVYASPAMGAIVEQIRRIAPTDATVLITGESGTGKELVAQALHGYSDRWQRPFVAINCAAIPRDLMESELFGHVRGAFTGAVKDKPGKFVQAAGGTLLLDEMADLPPELQAKLLRVIETGQIDVVGGQTPAAADVRLLAATNADLEERVRDGRFREDLFYRLNVIPIRIPPLRERPEDIPALWDHFVRMYARGEPVRTSPVLIRTLMERSWPGNVRELANVCQRMVLLRASDLLDESGLSAGAGTGTPGELRGGAAPTAASTGRSPQEGAFSPARPSSPDGSSLPGGSSPQEGSSSPDGSITDGFLGALPEAGLSLPDLEREVILRALAKHGGNRTRTAQYLGIPRHVLLYRLEKYRIG